MIPLVESKRNHTYSFYLTEDVLKEEKQFGNFVTTNSFHVWDYSAYYLVSSQDCSIEDMEI